jgi:3-methylfumaryl-CoA hydratase
MSVPDIESLRHWIGRSETQVDHVTVPAVQRLSALLDRDDPLPRLGDVLPIGWYSVLFPRVVRRSQVGPDGHPARGDFLPPVALPRRMFAGRRTWFHAPLLVGDAAEKRASIKDVTSKQGRSGAMVFVTVRAEIHSPRGLAIVEEQDIVYRDAANGRESGERPADAAASTPALPEALWRRPFKADELTLFRYSALTFNGHRIHYDRPYTTGVEGYPTLVVNGGLATLLLYELARDHVAQPIAALHSRNLRPMFVDQALALEGAPTPDGGAWLRVVDPSGAITLAAEARFAAVAPAGITPD